MLTKEVKDLMHSSVLCWLATSATDGQPNVSPKEVWTSCEDKYILIANIASPQSLRNVRDNSLVCVSFVNIFLQKGYQLKGTAEILQKKDESFDHFAKPLIAMAGDKFPFAQLFKIKVETVKEILAPSYVLYPDETDEESQKVAAHQLYGVRSV